MTQDEIKKYLQDNLGIKWVYSGNKLFVALQLEGKTISKIPFEQY